MNEKIFSIAVTFCGSASAAIAALEQLKPAAGQAAAALITYFKAVRDVSHRLAGTSRTLGFEDFSALLVDLEALTRRVEADEIFDTAAFAEVVEGKIVVARKAAAILRPEDSRLCRGSCVSTGF